MTDGNFIINEYPEPIGLNVSKSGRTWLILSNGVCAYINTGWIAPIHWKVKEGYPNFVK